MMAHGSCMGLAMGPPCGTYCIACRPAKRTKQFLMGVPWLSDTDREKVEAANRVTAAALHILEWATFHGIPWICENPQTSLLWRLPRMRRLCRRAGAIPVLVHQCGYGTPWKKATIFMCFNIADPSRLEKLCRPVGNHLCVHSGLPHHTLQGSVNGQARTARAAAYPPKLCDQIAKVLADTAWCREFSASSWPDVK